MPQIPVVEGQSVQPERLRPNYTSSATPEGAFGETIADAGMRGAGALSGLGVAMNRANTTRVNVEVTNFDATLTNLWDEAQQRTGQKAVGVTADTMSQAVELAKETRKGLANDHQRELFGTEVMGKLAAQHAALLRYETGEAHKLGVDASIYRLAQEVANAGRMWTQLEVIANSLKGAETAVRSHPDFESWSPEHQATALSDANSSVYASMLRAQDNQGAHADFIKTFEAVQGQLNAKDLDEFSKAYKKTADEAAVYAAAAEIYKANSTFVHGRLVRLSEQGAYDAANLAPVSIRKDVIQEVHRMVAEAKSADDHRRQNLNDTAWRLYQSGGTAAIPMSVRSQMDGQALQGIKNAAEQDAYGPTWRPTVADDRVYYDWLALPELDKITPDNDPRTVLSGHVSTERMERAINDWRAIRDQSLGIKKNAGPAGKPKGTVVERGTIDSMIRDAAPRGVLGGRKNVYATRFGRFHDYVRDRVADQEEETGVKATREDVQKIIDEGLIKGEAVGGAVFGLVDPDIRKYEAEPGQTFRPFATPALVSVIPVGGIPADELAQIDAAIKGKGQTPTDELRRQLYERAHAAATVKP